MWPVCCYGARMNKMIQIRNVPVEIHGKLKARAAMEGVSMSDYLLSEIVRIAERPMIGELRERLGKRTRVFPETRPAEVVREGRNSR